MIRLKTLFKDVDYLAKDNLRDIYINSPVVDSRAVKNGDLFVAIKGANLDGHNFINEAIERGAKAVVLERDDRKIESVKKIKVKDTKKTLPLLARNYYRDPSRDINVIGVTGTNGKTTVTYLLESIFKKALFRVGLIGTIKYKIEDEIIVPSNTTPSSLELQMLLKKMVGRSLNYCIMEVSSHALDQHRTDCVDFNTAIFTNASSEHLDYHKNFARYLNAKLRLFRGLNKESLVIINNDDPNSCKVKHASVGKRVATFGLKKDCDVYADEIKLRLEESRFVVHAKEGPFSIRSSLIGIHNVYNILAAATCAINEGIDLNIIKRGIEAIKGIPGRLQLVRGFCDFKIFVDYAHTDDALKKVLSILKRLKRNRLITVFGCGGNRDREKRPRMGKIATDLSDYAIITSDNPRDEDPSKIANDIVKGISKKQKNFKVILDRQTAVEEALSSAKQDDIVLIAGKGHENHQIVKDKIIPFNDLDAAKNFLKERAKCLV